MPQTLRCDDAEFGHVSTQCVDQHRALPDQKAARPMQHRQGLLLGVLDHWARELTALGHTVKLMPPAYVKAYVKRNKNELGVEAVVPLDRLHQARLLHFVRDVVVFRIHIGIDVMHDLTGGVAEAHPLVECPPPIRGGPSYGLSKR